MGGKLLDALKRYGLAVALPGLALTLNSVLPFPEGAGIYQLPLVAVVLSAWYGGRGPGLLASLVCITGVWYWFVPPVHSWDISPEHATGFSIFIALSLLLTQFGGARRRAEAEHLAHMRFLESMDRVNRAIQGTGNLEQMMNDVLDAVLSIFECDRAVLGRHRGDPTRHRLRCSPSASVRDSPWTSIRGSSSLPTRT